MGEMFKYQCTILDRKPMYDTCNWVHRLLSPSSFDKSTFQEVSEIKKRRAGIRPASYAPITTVRQVCSNWAWVADLRESKALSEDTVRSGRESTPRLTFEANWSGGPNFGSFIGWGRSIEPCCSIINWIDAQDNYVCITTEIF